MRVPYYLFLTVAIAVLNGPAHAGTPCSDLSPPDAPTATLKRSLVASDLVVVRDIGSSLVNDPAAKSFSLSPDGKTIAFQMRRAEPSTDSYCLGMFVLPLTGGGKPISIDTGGEYIMSAFRSQGFARSIPPGAPLVIEPLWSPDGTEIAYLRRDSGITQVWVAKADGTGSRAVTRSRVDVESLAWKDPRVIVIASRPGLATSAAAAKAEGASGYLYDERWIPASSNRPLPRDPILTQYDEVEVASGDIISAMKFDESLLDVFSGQSRPEGAVMFAKAPSGALAWTKSLDRTNVDSKDALWVREPGQKDRQCAVEACSGIVGLWWTADHGLIFQRSAGPPTGHMAIFSWNGLGAPRLLLDTADYLSGCQVAKDALLCRDEGSLQPARIVSVDLSTGKRTPIYDPNPEFAQLSLGPAERLTWTNAYGVQTYGDLVLPPHRTDGDRLPLIIVQYNSRGFLKGGTGDEFPIQLFATKGFAVLSVNRPKYYGLVVGAKTWQDMNRLSIKDWADRKSVQSTIETAVDMLVDQGLIDPKRVGITGLSDGASTVQFVIINSRKFAAAAMGTCCDEEASPGYLAGEANGAWLQEMGYPKLTDDGTAFWARDSLRANAATMNVPLLMQVPDDEYLGALEGYVALHEQRKPAELYVFPDETHIKWQPAHRLAAYTRYVDWFDFWLNGKEDSDPAKAAQYKRWEVLRAAH